MKKIGMPTGLFCGILFNAVCNAGPALLDAGRVADTPIKTIEAFTVDANPGKGTLNFKVGPKVETIELGSTTGFYAAGMVFHSSALPESLRQDFKGSHIIQIVLGTSAAKVKNQVPQFASAMLITKKIPTQKKIFRSTLPTTKDVAPDNLALILFSSPATLAERSDEEKLKSTYFSDKGVVTVVPKAKPQIVEIKSAGKALLYKMQTMQIEFNSFLVTPFNTQLADLKGTVEIPVYWPYGPEAETYAKKIAMETLGGISTPLQIPEGISHHNREIAGSSPGSRKKPARPAPEESP